VNDPERPRNDPEMREIVGDQPAHALRAVQIRFGFGLLLTWAGAFLASAYPLG
jgi:hypothetical protein